MYEVVKLELVELREVLYKMKRRGVKEKKYQNLSLVFKKNFQEFYETGKI
jgi:tRNA1(Val) A37 N6-methylase TrmN6